MICLHGTKIEMCGATERKWLVQKKKAPCSKQGAFEMLPSKHHGFDGEVI
jgi:hypothetical protein